MNFFVGALCALAMVVFLRLDDAPTWAVTGFSLTTYFVVSLGLRD